jgi:hypothetical protein
LKFEINNSVFSSNGIRLSWRQWLFAAMIVFCMLFYWPSIWQKLEKFQHGINFRMPYKLSSDYWLFERYCHSKRADEQVLLIGDSVIWGHYVSRDNTLSACLNNITGSNRFANFGLDGAHPAALDGLLRYYGRDIAKRKIILHLNPLWFSSPKHDLQTDKEFQFNHPELVAQFTPAIPCYKASFSKRFDIVLSRYIPLLNWTNHLNTMYFDDKDIPNWTIENPYKNPISAITLHLSETDEFEQPKAQTIISDNIQTTNNDQWVDLQTSIQWRFFRRIIALLQERKNRIFVIVGPFNEHRLEGTSLEAYRKLQQVIESWLVQNNIEYYIPPALPAALYIDASHPSNEGYDVLAQQLLGNQVLEQFLLFRQ